MKLSSLSFLFLCFSIFITSCSSDDNSTEAIIDLIKNPITVSFLGEEALEVEINTNVDNLHIYIDDADLSWINLTQPTTREARVEKIYFKINENKKCESREAKIKIRDSNNNKIIELTILQEARKAGIYTAKELIALGEELNKKQNERNKEVLSLYGIFNAQTNKWTFTQRKDIDLNPNITFKVDNSKPDNLTISYNGDIDSRWVPIGYSDEYHTNEVDFQDIYDGGGFKIKNLFIDGEYEYAGLFGRSKDAEFKNITIENGLNIAYFRSYNSNRGYGGGLVAYSANTNVENVHSSILISDNHSMTGGIIGYGKEMKIKGCSFTKTSVLLNSIMNDPGFSNPGAFFGGIIGYAEDVTIDDCKIHAVNIQLYNTFVGGIVGSSNYINISNCSSNLSVYVKEYTESNYSDQVLFGGIVGRSYTAKIIKSNTSGDLYFEGNRYFSEYGGIAGSVEQNSVIAGCENRINIKASASASGNIGGILGRITTSVYELTGSNLVIASYNWGNIESGETSYLDTGGIIGYGSKTPIIACYNVGLINTPERTSGSISGATDLVEAIKGTFWLTKTCKRAIGLWGESFSLEYEKTESELKDQKIVDELNTAIKDWNKQNPDRAVQIEYTQQANDYPRILN